LQSLAKPLCTGLRLHRAMFLRQDGTEAAMISWLGFGTRPQMLLIRAGRGRDNVLLSASPSPSIREYSRWPGAASERVELAFY
jgi:hypothetical protein